MLDSDFKIERPKRYYRQGFNLLHHDTSDKDEVEGNGSKKATVQYDHESGFAHAFGTMTHRMSKIFHVGHHEHGHAANGTSASVPGTGGDSDSDSSDSPESSRPATPLLDPSTNTNPLEHPDAQNNARGAAGGEDEKKKKKRAGDVSKHTFFIENSMMRLKLFARNEVRKCFRNQINFN